MNIIKYISFAFIVVFWGNKAFSQDTLKLNRTQCEAIFLKENLLLIAEKLSISQAEARVLQAKLWPNPTFTFDQVNLWATPAQTGGQEVIPPLGIIGPNQQFGLALEQLILTARKRSKQVEIEKVSVEISKQYFEELLRALKIEFRNQLTQLQYLQLSKIIYESQLNAIKQLTQAYQKQVQQGNMSQGEYIRLKALELEITKTINEQNQDINQAQKALKVLMRLPPTATLTLFDEGYKKDIEQYKKIILNELLQLAKDNRPDYKITQLQESYFNKLYVLERAKRVPDVTVGAAYDRGGNAMLNFLGIGVSMDLPVFNRNQGNIKYAKIGIEQSKLQYQQKTITVENETALAYNNVMNALQFLKQIENDYESKLDNQLDAYTKNFANKNISMLEYLDFLDAYLSNKKIILEASKELNTKTEELNFTVGTDLIK